MDTAQARCLPLPEVQKSEVERKDEIMITWHGPLYQGQIMMATASQAVGRGFDPRLPLHPIFPVATGAFGGSDGRFMPSGDSLKSRYTHLRAIRCAILAPLTVERSTSAVRLSGQDRLARASRRETRKTVGWKGRL